MSRPTDSGAEEGLGMGEALPVETADDARRTFPFAAAFIFIGAWLGGSWLAVGAWLRPILPGGWWTVALICALLLFPIVALARGLRQKSYPSRAVRLLILRPFWYAMLFMPLLAGTSLLAALVGLPFGESPLAARWSIAVAAALLAVAAAVGYRGTRRLVTRRLEVGMPRLPSPFDGLRVVQISDLHVGPHTGRGFLRRVVETVAAESPDLIVVTGDQVDDFARDADEFNQAFEDLRAPLGTYVVAGNHDVYAGWVGVRERLSAAGHTILVNSSLAIERERQRLWIAGTGDPAASSWPDPGAAEAVPDIDRTLAEIPEDEPVLALAHNPALWPALVSRGVDLTLSGHTHYGQLAIPEKQWCAASPFLELAMGAHHQGRSLLYINPGTNYWGIPFRIGTPPEVTLLTLRSTGSDAYVRERK